MIDERRRSTTAPRSWALFILRTVISLALLGWLLHQLRGGLREVESIDLGSLVPAMGLFALSTVLGAVQWTLILRHAGITVPWTRLHQVYWVGLFCNNFLPSNVGGDIVKVADVAVASGRLTRTLAGTLLDRLLGLAALVSLAFVAGAWLGGRSPAGIPWWLLATIGVPVVGVSGALLSGRMGRFLVRSLRRMHLSGPGARVESLVLELQAYRSAPLFVLQLAGIALVVQTLRVLTHVLVAASMGISTELPVVLDLFVLVPILGIAVVLPISLNGLGVRELVATRLMPQVGIAAPTAFTMQIVTYLVQVAVSAVGGLVLVWMMMTGRLTVRRPKRANPAA
jgi:uncharacterized membrane protein YbhN (UPF0104 family)